MSKHYHYKSSEIMYLFEDNSKTMEFEIANNGTKGFYLSPCYDQEMMVKMVKQVKGR